MIPYEDIDTTIMNSDIHPQKTLRTAKGTQEHLKEREILSI